MKKAKLCYCPWKIAVRPEFQNISGSGLPIAQQIYEGVERWKEHHAVFGDGEDGDRTVFALIDGCEPKQLLGKHLRETYTAASITPAELPTPLRKLYEKLTRLGHAEG